MTMGPSRTDYSGLARQRIKKAREISEDYDDVLNGFDEEEAESIGRRNSPLRRPSPPIPPVTR